MKTVNFIEAMNSGKRFRVINSLFYRADRWYEVNNSNYVVFSDNREALQSLAPNKDFINSQFELEEKQITITESQLDAVFDKTHAGGNFWKDFKKELGF